MTFKERVVRDVKMYFEPLTWAFSPKKHFKGFLFFWGYFLFFLILLFLKNNNYI
jgi:hypothetical protein